MRKVLLLVAGLLCISATPALAANGKTTICHKGHTLSVSTSAVKAHVAHGDKVGTCQPHPTPPPVTEPPVTSEPPVSRETFHQVNRLVACADRPVLRVADNSFGIAVDLDLATWGSGVYAGVTFTPARFYEGVGATCDRLPGFHRVPNVFVGATGTETGVYPFYAVGAFTL